MLWAFKILRRTIVRELPMNNKSNRSYLSYPSYLLQATKSRVGASTMSKAVWTKLRLVPSVHSKDPVLRVILASRGFWPDGR
jgi:hypothetical protein